MAAGDRIFTCSSFTFTTARDGIRYAVVSKRRLGYTEDPGLPTYAGGPAEVQPGPMQIEITVYGTNVNVLNALCTAAKASAVIAYKGAAGANETATYTNVLFTEFVGETTFRDPDTGGVVAMAGVRGVVQWGAAEVLSDVEKFA
jgi:hypothetical protein